MRRRGIDVSSYQGRIDWERVRPFIDFAIIRIGFGSSGIDREFRRNANECERLNIPYGFYLYSYARDEEEALREAEHTLRLIENYRPTYPIYYDYEDRSFSGLSKEEIEKNINKYCETLEKHKYYVGIYSSLNWFLTKLDSRKLDRYDKWLAEWNDRPTYRGEFGMWQYDNDGIIRGIEARVDQDIAFKDYPKIIRDNGLNNSSRMDFIRYTVVSGDTLYSIAERYNTNWNVLASLNNIKEPYLIYPGEILLIPQVSESDIQVGDTVDLKNIILYENVNSDEGTISSKESGIVTRIYEGTQNALQIDYNLGYVKTSDLKK